MYKPMINNYNKSFISRFSTNSRLSADRDKSPRRLFQNELDKINQELTDLDQEIKVLREDLAKITQAVPAASDALMDRTPEEKADNTLSDLKGNYESFFDSEGEDEGVRSGPNRLMMIKSYIKGEIKANESTTSELNSKANNMKVNFHNNLQKLYTPEQLVERGLSVNRPDLVVKRGESSRRQEQLVERGESSRGQEQLSERRESSKRKLDTSDGDDSSVSSKKSRQSPSDYIDSLPELPYNPFDD